MIMPLTTDTCDIEEQQIKLTVELMGALFKQGKRIADIARYTKQNPGNVSRFYKRHREELEYIRDNQDHISGAMYKRIEFHANKHTLLNLTDTKLSKKVSPSQSIVMGSIATQNRRLLQGESTANISVKASQDTIKDIDAQILAVEAKLDVL